MRDVIFTDIKAISLSGDGPVNEDLCFCDGKRAWVLDGAAGPEGRQATGWDSDARWLVNRMDAALKGRLPGPGRGVAKQQHADSLADVVVMCIEAIEKQYQKMWGEDRPDKSQVPSASGALVRCRGEMLEYLVFGDSPLLLRFRDGRVQVFLDQLLRDLDARALALGVEQSQTSGLPLSQCREAMLPALIENRKQMNTANGYYSISNVPTAGYLTIGGQIPLAELDAVCLLSGGFARHYDLFGLSRGPEEFMELAEKAELAELGAALRAAQQADPEMRRYPRLQCCEDASAVFFRIAQ